jgi:type I restriction enzyme S subunit
VTGLVQPHTAKDGRIHWLTDLPAAWDIVPSKWLFTESKERAREDDQQLSATQAYGVIPQREFEEREGRRVVHVFKHLDKRKHVALEDFVISMRSFQGGLEIARAEGCIRSSYVVLKPTRNVHPPFYAHLFKSRAYIQALQATSNFIRDGQDLNFGNFAAVNLPRVPLPTQRAIADFLDRKTAAIDAVIEKKERLIALLAEKRAALIHQAVTKGLDPDVPMKDSGVPWIGEIPAHWEVKPLKFACVLQRGFDLPSQDRREGDIPIVAGGGISGWHDTPVISPPCVVTGRYGTVGEVHLIKRPCWPLNTSLYVKEFWGNSPEYIRHLLSAAPMKMYSGKSAVPGVDRNDLHIIPVAMPDRSEQEMLVLELRTRLARADALRSTVAKQIDKLREYRQALITAAVTGQLNITAPAEDTAPIEPQLPLFTVSPRRRRDARRCGSGDSSGLEVPCPIPPKAAASAMRRTPDSSSTRSANPNSGSLNGASKTASTSTRSTTGGQSSPDRGADPGSDDRTKKTCSCLPSLRSSSQRQPADASSPRPTDGPYRSTDLSTSTPS